MTSGTRVERPRQLGNRRLGQIAAAVVAVAMLAGVVIVWFTPVLGLRTVSVTGAVSQDVADEVRQAASVADGTPLMRIDLSDVADRIRGVGSVSSVTVQRQWPHVLDIAVTQRTAVAVTQANGQWWLVDGTGLPFRTVSSVPDDMIPLVLATPGPTDSATLAALTLAQALPSDLASRVKDITAPTGYDLSLELADGRTVVIGDSRELERKFAVLPAMLAQPGTTFDVTDPTLVTVVGGTDAD